MDGVLGYEIRRERERLANWIVIPRTQLVFSLFLFLGRTGNGQVYSCIQPQQPRGDPTARFDRVASPTWLEFRLSESNGLLITWTRIQTPKTKLVLQLGSVSHGKSSNLRSQVHKTQALIRPIDVLFHTHSKTYETR